MELCCWIQKSRLGFPSWSSSDSTFCRLRWCPGLLGVSASRLLCFFPWEVATLLWCLPHLSFLHRASAFCHSSKLNLPPNPILLYLKVFGQQLLYLSYFSKCQIILKTFSPFSHSFANLEACKTNDLKKKIATSPILKLETGGLWDTHKL